LIWFYYFEVVMAFEFCVLIEVISHFRLQDAELLATDRNRLPCDALGKGGTFLLFFFFFVSKTLRAQCWVSLGVEWCQPLGR